MLNLKKIYHVHIRHTVLSLLTKWYKFRYGMDLHPTVRISLKAKLDKTNPKGIHVEEGTYIAFGAVILTHDMCRALHKDVYIGRNCFIGGNSIILPGVNIGNNCIVAAGATVSKSVPDGSIVGGNPAVIIKEGIKTKALGILTE